MRRFLLVFLALLIVFVLYANKPEERIFAVVCEVDKPQGTDPGLLVIDVTDSENPTVVDRISLTYPLYSCNNCENCMFAMENNNMGKSILSTFDCSNPYEITKISSLDLGDAVGCCPCLTNNLLYIADMAEGLTVVDISDRSNPEVVGCTQFEESSTLFYSGLWESFYMNDYVFATVVDWSASDIDYFLSFDVSDPKNPMLVDQIKTSPFRSIFLEHIGNYAYIGSDCGLMVVDISDPSNLEVVSEKIVTGSGGDIEIAGNHLYMTEKFPYGGPSVMKIFDISNPFDPQVVSEFIFREDMVAASYIQVVDNIAYVSSELGLTIVDVSNVYKPVLVNIVPPTQREGYNYTAQYSLNVLKSFNIDQE